MTSRVRALQVRKDISAALRSATVTILEMSNNGNALNLVAINYYTIAYLFMCIQA
jgi:hypothetical protein